MKRIIKCWIIQKNSNQYSIWFDDSFDIHGLHKRMITGDILRVVYGPSSLILDRYHREQHGDVRPRNRWDDQIRDYDRQVSMLGASTQYTSGISYETVLAAVRLIQRFGGNDINLGLAHWFSAIQTIVENPAAALLTLETIQQTQEEFDWMYQPARLSMRQIRLALVGPDNSSRRYVAAIESNPLSAASQIRTDHSSKLQRRAAAKFITIY